MSYSHLNPRFCPHCRKARKACICEHINSFHAPKPICIWTHVAEETRSRSTSWLAHRMITESVYTVVRDEVCWPEPLLGKWALLFPGPSSRSWDQVDFDGILAVDGTWDECRSMVANCPYLQTLPQVTFQSEYVGINTVRRPPVAGALCTAEALGRLCVEMGCDKGARLVDLVHMLNAREDQFLHIDNCGI